MCYQEVNEYDFKNIELRDQLQIFFIERLYI